MIEGKEEEEEKMMVNKGVSGLNKSALKVNVKAKNTLVSRRNVAVKAANREMWLVGSTPPAHLDGSMAGNFGFDPLGLGANPDRLKWYQEAELMNGRFAMLGALGILGTDLMGVEGEWYERGAYEYNIPLLPLVAVQAVVMGFLETKRYQGFKKTGQVGKLGIPFASKHDTEYLYMQCGLVDTFPFDPINMTSDTMKLKEVKNGRLAMVSIFAFI